MKGKCDRTGLYPVETISPYFDPPAVSAVTGVCCVFLVCGCGGVVIVKQERLRVKFCFLTSYLS